MVENTPTPLIPNNEILPLIDLKGQRDEVSKLIVKACEDFGFFKLINHGVPMDVISSLEEASFDFFAKPSSEKERASLCSNPPYGYGCKNIGLNGDVGEVEYLILDAKPAAITTYPINLRDAVSSYVEAVRELACEILDLMAEGLGAQQTSVFSSFIRAVNSDSLLRLNHYPPLRDRDTSPSTGNAAAATASATSGADGVCNRIGFGEHTDPQILTILKSNGVGGLQISVQDGVWVPVSPHPTAFFVNVGDVLQAMTNGKFLSVRHRAMVNWQESRMSMAYFASPSLDSRISPLAHLVTPNSPRLYRSFTWAEYKKATYSGRLGDSRLNLFRIQPGDETAAKQ
ncbi:OLC1v1020543C1 [Oldenlandia corymbosa var. corymbosa]|uniref:gibberellin 2beta-dioxygenase n=1 Tax=Oldenlandia corymbosa var. corymbosa TaxID=529605 RepID=A0AAV1EGV1_OLDCO|nr:OLC1v1020543C1 [Oldenlandia corymbosa var. corymbosa]